MVLTSPPYFRLRDYGQGGQIGLEPHVDDWVQRLLPVMRELRRVLRPTGSLWLNLGDTYATHLREGAERKSLLLGPERLALAMAADGWILRNKIVWAKTNPRPTSVPDRLACTWEPVYLFAAGPRAFFDIDAIRQPHRTRPPQVRQTGKHGCSRPGAARGKYLGPNSDRLGGLTALKAQGRVGHPLGKNPGDVWQLATGGLRIGSHPAVFPPALAERAILAGCPERRCSNCRTAYRRLVRRIGATAVRGALRRQCSCTGKGFEPGVVLDPFLGAGTTALAAERLGRDWVGIELNPDYAALTIERLRQERATKAVQPDPNRNHGPP
nr:site-specific DNA-methyltransferase [Nakamurella multipartita]